MPQTTRRKQYTEPESPLAAYIWRKKMLFNTTFPVLLLEPWELAIWTCICTILLALVTLGLYKYLPHHLALMSRRAKYYWLGQEGQEGDFMSFGHGLEL